MSQTKLTAIVFCTIYMLTVAAGGMSVAIGQAVPHAGPTAPTEAPAWSAL